jgi:hypothetical protein
VSSRTPGWIPLLYTIVSFPSFQYVSFFNRFLFLLFFTSSNVISFLFISFLCSFPLFLSFKFSSFSVNLSFYTWSCACYVSVFKHVSSLHSVPFCLFCSTGKQSVRFPSYFVFSLCYLSVTWLCFTQVGAVGLHAARADNVNPFNWRASECREKNGLRFPFWQTKLSAVAVNYE